MSRIYKDEHSSSVDNKLKGSKTDAETPLWRLD